MSNNNKPKRSSIWIYFEQHAKDKGKCYICGTIISTRGGSISNLKRHLKAKHKKNTFDLTPVQSKKCKSSDKTEEEVVLDDSKREDMVVDNNENYHSEVVFHDYANVEEIEAQLNEDNRYKPTITNKSPMKKPNILQRRTIPVAINDTRVAKVNNQVVIANQKDRKLEALESIATNLGRIATVFETVSKIMGSLNEQNNDDDDEDDDDGGDNNDDVVETASAETGVKVDGLIMSVVAGDDHNF